MGLLGETGRISIHAPRTGSDKNSYDFIYNFNLFQSTLPARGATTISIVPSLFDLISIHAPRTGSDIQAHRIAALVAAISIHAPRTGSDAHSGKCRDAPEDFNPRSPHGERRRGKPQRTLRSRFQSTLPARGATLPPPSSPARTIFQSTLPARGATPPCTGVDIGLRISIHAPRTGSDGNSFSPLCRSVPFQSTLPARGATAFGWATGADGVHFNPRSPHGERPGESSISSQLSQFQSTLPARGATAIFSAVAFSSSLFQSTLPARGATDLCAGDGLLLHISIHAPRTGSDVRGQPHRQKNSDFNPRSPHGERPSRRWCWMRRTDFNPRSPHGERLRL